MKPERQVLDPNVLFDADQADMPKPQPGPQEKALREQMDALLKSQSDKNNGERDALERILEREHTHL